MDRHTERQTNELMDGWTGRQMGHTDSPGILLDFVPFWFPQDKGTNDHLLPLGDWFSFFLEEGRWEGEAENKPCTLTLLPLVKLL